MGAKGQPKTGGRRKGSLNKRTIGREAVLKVATTPLTKKLAAEGKIKRLTPLEFLEQVYAPKGKVKIPLGYQIDAAKAAAPYIHPKLVAVTMKSTSKVLNVDAKDAIASGSVDAEALYRDIMGSGDESEDD